MKKEEKKKKWGGKRVNSGRKSIPNEEKKVAVTIYVKAKFKPLFEAKATVIRDQIEKGEE